MPAFSTHRERCARTGGRRAAAAAATAVVLPCLAMSASASAATDLADPTYGQRGFAQGPASAAVRAAAVDGSGSVVVVGTSSNDRFQQAVRFTPDGHVDAQFGSGGVAEALSSGAAGAASSVTFDGGGNVVVAGPARNSIEVNRLTPQGADDPSFAGFSYSQGGANAHVDAVVATPDGGYLIRGASSDDTFHPFLIKLTGAGQLDPAFAASAPKPGVLAAPELSEPGPLAVSQAGEIVASCVDSSGHPCLVAYTPSGSLDTSFGSGGTAATGLVGQLHGLQFRPDGTLFAAGSAPCPACSATEGRLGLAQFDSTGHSNSAFGTNGVASSEIIGGCAPALSSVTVAPDGSVFAGGTACGDSGPIIIKFTSTGQVDPTFGDNGMYQPAAAPAGSVPQAPNGLHGLTWTPAGLVYGTEAVRTSSAATPDSIFSAERVLTSGGSPYPDRTPLTTITPQVVKFGQVATVAVTGTAGATVDLYARRYPNRTFTQIRSGIVLDSAGRASIPTKPDVNLRFQVIDRALPHSPSSVGGADGFITVQKNLTLNARRISLRRYTFTGSMNPYQRGATVSLYRNGTLVRSGIPVSSSKVYSYTAMLAAGTANFQFRSAATGYNGASGSSTKSVRIF